MSLNDLLAAKSTLVFTKTFFKNPIDHISPWEPFDSQTKIYQMVDYGWDNIHKSIKPTKFPRIIVMVFPRQFGKTHCVASLASSLLIRYPGCKIGVMSNKDENAKKFISLVNTFIRATSFRTLITTDKTSVLSLTFPPNDDGVEFTSLIESYGQTENIRGNSYTWLIMDESAQFTEEIAEGAAMPTVRIAGAHNKYGTPSIIMLSTPRGRQGIFWKYYKLGIDTRRIGCCNCKRIFEREEVPRDITWSTINPPSDLRLCSCSEDHQYEFVDGSYVASVNIDPWSHPYISREELEMEIKLKGNTPLVRQEYLGEFIEAGAGVFYESWLNDCVDPTLTNTIPTGIPCVVSIDYGKHCDATVITVGHNEQTYVGTQIISTPVIDFILHLPAKGGMDYAEMRYHLLSIIATCTPYLLIPDSTGLGDPEVEQLTYDIYTIKHQDLHGFYFENGDKNGKKIEYVIPCNPHLETRIYQTNEFTPPGKKKKRAGFVFEYNNKFNLIHNTVVTLSTHKCKIPSKYSSHAAEIMFEEFKSYGYDYSSNNRIIYGTQSEHDDIVIAVALLFWGLHDEPYYYSEPKLGAVDHFILHDIPGEGFESSNDLLGREA